MTNASGLEHNFMVTPLRLSGVKVSIFSGGCDCLEAKRTVVSC